MFKKLLKLVFNYSNLEFMLNIELDYIEKGNGKETKCLPNFIKFLTNLIYKMFSLLLQSCSAKIAMCQKINNNNKLNFKFDIKIKIKNKRDE